MGHIRIDKDEIYPYVFHRIDTFVLADLKKHFLELNEQ